MFSRSEFSRHPSRVGVSEPVSSESVDELSVRRVQCSISEGNNR